MFNDSKYTRWYFSIIDNARLCVRSKKDGYFENHHIIPRSMGGDNTKRNLVLLTAREHYICHVLLPRMCTDSTQRAKMVYAMMYLSEGAGFGGRSMGGYRGRSYSIHKEAYAASISGKHSYMYGVQKSDMIKARISASRIRNGSGVGEKNPMHGKHHTDESKQQMSEVKRQRIQERGVDFHKERAIGVNPRTRPVVDHLGQQFPSLSAAGRHYGYAGAQGVRGRIARGEWSYCNGRLVEDVL